MRGLLASLVVLVLATAACAFAQQRSPSGGTPSASASRPQPIGGCTVTPGVAPELADRSLAGVRGIAFGRAPIFAVIDGATTDRISFPTYGQGVFITKVQWMATSSYSGTVRVSGKQLDGSGHSFFGPSPDHLSSMFQWSVPGISGPFEPSAAGIEMSGCYEWTVVGDTFSNEIVFRGVAGGSIQ